MSLIWFEAFRRCNAVGGAEREVELGHDRNEFDDFRSALGALGQVTFDHHHLGRRAGAECEDPEELCILATRWDDVAWFQAHFEPHHCDTVEFADNDQIGELAARP